MTLHAFAMDESGATAVEYGVIATVVAAIIILVFPTLQGPLTTALRDVADRLTDPSAFIGGAADGGG